MEKSTPIGIIAGFGLIFGAIFIGDGWQTFFDVPSLILVLGGSSSAILVGFSLSELKTVARGTKEFFTFQAPDFSDIVTQFVELSRTARREGLLALDRKVGDVEDGFVRMGLEMAVDGVEEQEINDLMRMRTTTELSGRQLLAKFYNAAGTYCPAFGMVGTLIGLIQMMQNLTDPSAIGAGMATAMITTFYGALIANLVLLPIANKVKLQTSDMAKARSMVRTGVLAIVRGESPTVVEQRLKIMLGDTTAQTPTEAEVIPMPKAA